MRCRLAAFAGILPQFPKRKPRFLTPWFSMWSRQNAECEGRNHDLCAGEVARATRARAGSRRPSSEAAATAADPPPSRASLPDAPPPYAASPLTADGAPSS
eukprot:7380827-Pyramimonas_sp.AAC.1